MRLMRRDCRIVSTSLKIRNRTFARKAHRHTHTIKQTHHPQAYIRPYAADVFMTCPNLRFGAQVKHRNRSASARGGFSVGNDLPIVPFGHSNILWMSLSVLPADRCALRIDLG